MLRLPTPNSDYVERHPQKHSIRLGGHIISLTRLADDAGFSKGYISKIMNGKARPSIDYGIHLASTLGWTLDELLAAIADRQRRKEAA